MQWPVKNAHLGHPRNLTPFSSLVLCHHYCTMGKIYYARSTKKRTVSCNMLQHNLPSFLTKANRTTYLVSCRAFTLPPSGVVLNYPCREHTANLCHVLSISGMRGLQEKENKEKKKREKRGNYGKLENLVILFAQRIFPSPHLPTYSPLI